MKTRNMRWVAWLLVWMLALTALPVAALADGWSLAANLPTNRDAALTTNSKLMDLTVTFNNVVDIKCLVQAEGSQAVNTYENPQVQGNQAIFSGVVLSPGINQISFLGTSGSLLVQSATYYVEFLNNPRISNVQVQGTNIDADSTVAVKSGPASLQYDTENATQSSVNGMNVIGAQVGTKQTWTTSLKLTPGETPLNIVASNPQRSVAVQKSAVLLDSATGSAPFGVFLTGGNGGSTHLWAGQKVQITGPQPLTVAGQLATPQLSGTTAPTVEVSLDNGAFIPVDSLSQASGSIKDVTQWGVPNTLQVWNWSLALPALDTTKPDHALLVRVTVNGTANQSPVGYFPFTYLDTTQPYWSNPAQLFSVNWSGSTAQAGQSIAVTEPWTVSQAPVDLALTLNNFQGTPDFSQIKIRAQDGQGRVIADNVQAKVGTLSGQPNTAVMEFGPGVLPSGDYNLVISIPNITMQPFVLHTVVQLSPMLKVAVQQNGTPLSDGQVVGTGDPVSVTVQPINFSQFPTVSGAVNGLSLTLTSSNGQYQGSNIQLSEGANTFTFTAEDPVTRVKVTSTVTIYKAIPSNLSIPLFQAISPADGQVLPYDASTRTYSTSSQRVDLELKVGPVGTAANNINRIDLFENGALLTTVSVNSPSQNQDQYTTTSINGITWYYQPAYIREISVDGNNIMYLHLSGRDPNNGANWVGIAMPANQTTSFKVTAYSVSPDGKAIGQQVTQTLLVANQLKPYQVYIYQAGDLKPVDLAQTLQVNQNYLDVVIATPSAADAVTVNRQPAVQWKDLPSGVDSSQWYYGVELQNLKAGANKIPFTVQSGTSKQSGTLLVNNLDQALTYAQAKMYFGKSSSITVFDKSLTLKFPSNTMLAEAVPEGSGEQPSTGATNDRYLLFGIADPGTGAINPNTPSNGNPFMKVPDQLPPGGWAVASPVYWIDAGPKDMPNLPPFVPPGGIDPFNADKGFAQRGGPSGGANDWMQPTKDGTLILSYDPAIRNQEAGRLTVFYLDLSAYQYNGATSAWRNLGGVVNLSNHTISVPFRRFGYYVVAKEVYSYQDVASHSWAKDYLETMYSKGIMTNDPALVDAFNPDVSITRGEFTTMVVKMLGLPLNYDDNHRLFIDVSRVPGGLYDYRYIETAARAGIVHGTGPDIFRPGDPLSRQEAATMIAAAMNLKMTDGVSAKAALSRMYGDANSVDLYAAPAVLAVSQKKIMTHADMLRKHIRQNAISAAAKSGKAVPAGTVVGSRRALRGSPLSPLPLRWALRRISWCLHSGRQPARNRPAAARHLRPGTCGPPAAILPPCGPEILRIR
ncbi:MAG: S-layer homology domain-containing protein [Kyrpidia sp.]|nr:S-layer homology domain-containing protein [Kyrpidia sp.]